MIISEMRLSRRPTSPVKLASTLGAAPSPEQLKALARLADYPRRVERLRHLAVDVQRWDGRCQSRSSSGASLGRLGRSYSSSRLVRAGASTLDGRRAQRLRASSVVDRRSSAKRAPRRGFMPQGPFSAAQLHDLMTRDITPEDYEMLLLLDEGVNRPRMLSSSAAAAIPLASGTAWIGEECRICLCELESEDDARALPACGHTFHAACVERWLSSSKASCPLCGAEVQDGR